MILVQSYYEVNLVLVLINEIEKLIFFLLFEYSKLIDRLIKFFIFFKID